MFSLSLSWFRKPLEVVLILIQMQISPSLTFAVHGIIFFYLGWRRRFSGSRSACAPRGKQRGPLERGGQSELRGQQEQHGGREGQHGRKERSWTQQRWIRWWDLRCNPQYARNRRVQPESIGLKNRTIKLVLTENNRTRPRGRIINNIFAIHRDWVKVAVLGMW